MSNLFLEQNQLKMTIKEIILELFSEPEEDFLNLLANQVIEKTSKKRDKMN